MKKSSSLVSTMTLVIQILVIVLVIWVLWLWTQPSQDAGDGIALGIFAGGIVLPLYVIGLLLTLIFRRTRKHIVLACVPLVLIAGSMLTYHMTRISHFDATEYQYLVGKNISETTELFQKATGGTGATEENGMRWYTLPGMILWVDKNENIVKIEPYE